MVTVFPGEEVKLRPDHTFTDGQIVALEPRTISKSYAMNKWPEPQIVEIQNKVHGFAVEQIP